MKKITFLLLFICSTASAREVALGEVLEWKYGPVASTEQVDQTDLTSQYPKMKITEWRSKVEQPSEVQIQQDTVDYKNYLEEKEKSSTTDKALAIQKLNLTEKDIKALKEILK